ncbi:NAD(P)-dependent oxidoreductase [Candidatus Parcubacteria bacterium]|nr:MAG: NAD(P)-dependent oxidoreductase [Candidatus Parcubacteria bacterium]
MTSYDFSKVLTTGANGMIGSYVDFGMRTDSATLDILDAEGTMRLVEEYRPSAVIHLAGATDMERCEREPVYAYELNVRGTYNVARAARAVDAVFVYASTSRVFKGDKKAAYTEEDTPDPVGRYAETKYFGELVTASIAPKYIIARTVWVFGGGPERDNKFYGNVLRQLDKPEIVALNDVRGSPTYGKDYVQAIKKLLMEGEYGIFHIANEGIATRFDTASAIATQLKSDAKVRAVDRSFFPFGATLPTNESIVSKRVTLRPWREALAEYITDEWEPYLRSATITS